MPKRTDIHKILIIGSGPIIISQACEFDYSGTQACKALKEEGYEVVLVNSNPATIMTDPETADRTYVEPITPEAVAKIIARERPDALLPTLGGQTGLNLTAELHRCGVLDRFGQIEPVVLVAADGYTYGGRAHDRRDELGRILEGLPTLRAVVVVPLAKMPLNLTSSLSSPSASVLKYARRSSLVRAARAGS